MNEITRIHLAKSPYNIELSAKRRLDAYLRDLQAFAGEAEVMDDIELRMTELLAERHVLVDGTIVLADIEALIKQLGSPESFADDAAPGISSQEPTGRRLYRDTARGRLGGVASGLALYLGVSVVWVRLVLILLALISFGTITLIYLVLWLIVPPVASPSDMLRLAGRPITLSTLKSFGSDYANTSLLRNRSLARGLMIMLGFGFVAATLAALAATAAGAYLLLERTAMFGAQLRGAAEFDQGLIAVNQGLLILSGLLLAALMVVGAYAAFARKFTRRIAVAAGSITVLGLISFGSGAAMIVAGHDAVQKSILRHTTDQVIAVPAEFRSVTELTTAVGNAAEVTYIVSTDAPKLLIRQTVYDGKMLRPKVEVTGKIARLIVEGQSASKSFCDAYCSTPTITIYGPALENLKLDNTPVYYAASQQAKLMVVAQAPGRLSITGGRINALTAELAAQTQLYGDGATIDQATIKLVSPSTVRLGAVHDLSLDAPTACPAAAQADVSVAQVAAGSVTLNGKSVAPHTEETPCLNLDINNHMD